MKKAALSRIISAVAVFALCFSALSSTVSAMTAATSSKSGDTDSQKPSFNYVALGASNTAGYGLHGYNYDHVYEYPTEKSIGNRYGYKMNPEDSYPVLIRDELNKSFNTNLEVIAASSMRAEEVHVLLDDDYTGDKYTDNWFFDMNGDGTSYFWSYYPGVYEYQRFAAAGVPGYNADPSYEPTKKEAFDALRKATKESVAKADLITVDAGMNNFGTYMFNLIATGWFSSDIGEINPELAAFYNDARDYAISVIKQFVGEGLPESMLQNFADTLAYAAVGYCHNIDAVMKHIFELNPDAEVVLISAQSMLHGLDIVMPGFDAVIPFGEIFDVIVNAANFYTAVLSPYADKYYFANVSNDGHVEFLKDEAAVYNGDPSTIPLHMKDCFDVLDGGMMLKTRVQQMFATKMSESGFVNMTDAQKDATTTDGVKIFHNGLHYERYDNTEFPPITLSDGTYLKDFLKDGEDGKLTGEKKAKYEIYERMLTLAYDVAMEVFGEAAKQSMVDLTVTMNPALSTIKAAPILLEVLGKAMVELDSDSDYSFSLNEMYPNGFFATYEQENGLPAGTLCSKFSFALFLEFAESAFSHPNYAGHKEVFDTTWEAYTKKLTGKNIADGYLDVDYTLTEDSYYVCVSDSSAGYADLFADRIGLNKDQLGFTSLDNIDYSKIDKADLISIGYNDPDMLNFAANQALAYVGNYISTDIRGTLLGYLSTVFDTISSKIPLLTVYGLKDTILNKADSVVDELLENELFADRTVMPMDWSSVLDAEQLPLVDTARAKVKEAVSGALGYESYTLEIDVVEWLALNAASLGFGSKIEAIFENVELIYGILGESAYVTVSIPVVDGLVFALESYLYSYVKYTVKSAELISYINANNPDAKIVILGHVNPIGCTYLDLGDTRINVGEIVELVALTSSARSLVEFSTSNNSAFVYIPGANSVYESAVEEGTASADIFGFFSLYLKDSSILDVSPDGYSHIADQMIHYVNVSCAHAYDDCSDTDCNICGEVRGAVAHSYGDWTVTKEATTEATGEESRACTVCGHTETKSIPKKSVEADATDSEGSLVLPIVIGAIAVACAGGFLVYWFVIRKKLAKK